MSMATSDVRDSSGKSEVQAVNFRDYDFADPADHAYRWIDVKNVELSTGEVSHDGVLAALIASEQYHDGYAGGGIDPAGDIHGPYLIARLEPSSYEETSVGDAVLLIERWAGQFGPIPRRLAADLEAKVFTVLRRADKVFRLRDLGPEARHEWSGVHIEFHEFVIVDKHCRLVTLLVAADD